MNDVVYGFRQLRRNPAFSLVAIATLALGIGANTAIFSVVNTVLLKPLPYPDAGRIVYIEGYNTPAGITDSNISYLDYTDWAKQTDLFEATSLYWVGNANLGPRTGPSPSAWRARALRPVSSRSSACNPPSGAHFSRKKISPAR